MNKGIVKKVMRPNWGASIETSLGGLQYYCQASHDDSFITKRTLCAVNLSYDETEVAFNSDRYHRMRTPKDCVVIAPAGTSVKERANSASDAVMFDVCPHAQSMLTDDLAPRIGREINCRDNLINPSTGDVARHIRTAFISGQAQDALLMESLMSQLQQTMFAAYYSMDFTQQTKPQVLSHVLVARVNEYIDAHLSETIKLSDLADLANVSVYHFARAYKHSTGESPYHAVVVRRLVRARQLLQANKARLVDIAVDCGFNSQAHMNEVFRRVLKVTPGTYRQVVNN